MSRNNVEEVPRPVLQKRRPKLNRETKNVLIFDEQARREYLTGFQKRKNERRQKAKLEMKEREKEEKKALKKKMREMIRKAEERHRIPELEEFLKSEVYEDSDHTVTITDLSSSKTDADADADHQETKQQKGTEEGEEDMESLTKKKKKLIHKLANVGNAPSKNGKVKRLGAGKFKGGGSGGGSGSKHRGKFQPRGHRKNSNKKKQRHK